MHVVLGLLGTIVTILVLLNRLAEAGIDLGGLNPFLWKRRRKWKKQYEGNPAFKLTDPMDVTALLMLAVAKCDGEITKEQKANILALFEAKFHLSRIDAQGLLIASSHLHGDGQEVRAKIREVMAPSMVQFTEDQARSAIALVETVAKAESSPSAARDDLVTVIEKEFRKKLEVKQSWATP